VSLYFGKAGTGGATGTLLKRDHLTDPGLALFMPKSPEEFYYMRPKGVRGMFVDEAKRG
jgi:hypothetical protein